MIDGSLDFFGGGEGGESKIVFNVPRPDIL